MAIKEPLEALATKPGFGWMQTLGPNMVSIFIIFALLDVYKRQGQGCSCS